MPLMEITGDDAAVITLSVGAHQEASLASSGMIRLDMNQAQGGGQPPSTGTLPTSAGKAQHSAARAKPLRHLRISAPQGT